VVRREEVPPSLVGGASKVRPQQGSIDVLLIRLDHRIRFEAEPAKYAGVVEALGRHPSILARYGNIATWPSGAMTTGSGRAGAPSEPPPPRAQLYSGMGNGAWQNTQVFDGAGAQELLLSGLSVDASGATVATYETRQDLAANVLGYASYLWRGGTTATLSTPNATSNGALLQTVGSSITKDGALRLVDANGYHVILPRDGDVPRSVMIPGTTPVPTAGCPVTNLTHNNPSKCMGHSGETCTLKGSNLLLTTEPLRTGDGALWVIFARQDSEQDVVLRDYTSGVSDPLVYCATDVEADRTTSNLYVARLASAQATTADVRLRIPLPSGPIGFTTGAESRFRARGNRLFLAYRFGTSTSPYRYLVLDTSLL
jgi:hypothetical protein